MKNKDIEELLNKAKDIAKYGTDGKQHTRMFNQFEAKALLSHIEQLEKENKFLRLDNPNANIKHFEMLKENKRKIDNLRYQNEQLQNNRDKAIEYIEKYKREGMGEEWFETSTPVSYLLNILKGDSDG